MHRPLDSVQASCGLHFRNPCTRAAVCGTKRETNCTKVKRKEKDWNDHRFGDGHKKWRQKVMWEVARMWINWIKRDNGSVTASADRASRDKYRPSRIQPARNTNLQRGSECGLWSLTHLGLHPSPAIYQRVLCAFIHCSLTPFILFSRSNNTYHTKLLWGLNEMMCVTSLVQCLGYFYSPSTNSSSKSIVVTMETHFPEVNKAPCRSLSVTETLGLTRMWPAEGSKHHTIGWGGHEKAVVDVDGETGPSAPTEWIRWARLLLPPWLGPQWPEGCSAPVLGTVRNVLGRLQARDWARHQLFVSTPSQPSRDWREPYNWVPGIILHAMHASQSTLTYSPLTLILLSTFSPALQVIPGANRVCTGCAQPRSIQPGTYRSALFPSTMRK